MFGSTIPELLGLLKLKCHLLSFSINHNQIIFQHIFLSNFEMVHKTWFGYNSPLLIFFYSKLLTKSLQHNNFIYKIHLSTFFNDSIANSLLVPNNQTAPSLCIWSCVDEMTRFTTGSQADIAWREIQSSLKNMLQTRLPACHTYYIHDQSCRVYPRDVCMYTFELTLQGRNVLHGSVTEYPVTCFSML